MPKYSFTIQNPAALTCERLVPPTHMAWTIVAGDPSQAGLIESFRRKDQPQGTMTRSVSNRWKSLSLLTSVAPIARAVEAIQRSLSCSERPRRCWANFRLAYISAAAGGIGSHGIWANSGSAFFTRSARRRPSAILPKPKRISPRTIVQITSRSGGETLATHATSRGSPRIRSLSAFVSRRKITVQIRLKTGLVPSVEFVPPRLPP